MSVGYRPRVMDGYLSKRLRATGALLIEGPKWCGKTTTGNKLSASSIFLQDPDSMEINMYYAQNKPSKLLEGDKPRLIDEWQIVPNIWNAVRFSVDRENKRGLYILTGSAVPVIDEADEAKMHTGIGRISRVRMRTMSLFETGESNGDVSVRELFCGRRDFVSSSDLDLESLAGCVCRGGWPSTLDMDEEDVLQTSKDYVEALVYSDISRADGIRRDPYVARMLLQSLSRNICTLADTTAICRDLGVNADRKTVTGYINALRRIFVVEDIPAWSPALMTKARLRSSSKRNLVDPSIAAAALNINPERLLNDFPAFGSLFESLCIRDLRVYSQPIEGKVYHYHDNSDLEVDAVIELDDGRWGAFEIKLHTGIDKAADSLLKLARKTKLSNGQEPVFLAVITGTGFYQEREDGVLVIPIGCLRD